MTLFKAVIQYNASMYPKFQLQQDQCYVFFITVNFDQEQKI